MGKCIGWLLQELITDTVAWRKDDGERDYGDGAATVASAMVRESEGEELGLSESV